MRNFHVCLPKSGAVPFLGGGQGERECFFMDQSLGLPNIWSGEKSPE